MSLTDCVTLGTGSRDQPVPAPPDLGPEMRNTTLGFVNVDSEAHTQVSQQVPYQLTP